MVVPGAPLNMGLSNPWHLDSASPNQISLVMANAIYPSDIFVVPAGESRILHVLSNLTR